MRHSMAIAAATLLLTASTAAAQSLKPFKFGISSPSVSVMHTFLADAYKVYEKHGLKVDIVSMEGGSRGVQVLLSGEIQAMSVGLGPTIQANTKGADLRMIASTVNAMPMTFFAQPRIKSAADVKGAGIGISTFGSETDIAVSMALRKWDLTRNDVTISQLGGTTQRYNALVSGRIDVVPLLDPGTTLARQKGTYTVLLDMAADRIPWIFDGVVVTAAGLKTNADAIERFLKATLEASWLGFSDADKAKQVITTRWKTKELAVIDATYASFRQLMPPDATPTKDGIANVIEQIGAQGTKVSADKIADHIDLRPIEAIKKAGFVEQLKKAYPVK